MTAFYDLKLTTFESSKRICETKNMTLPRTKFRAIEKHILDKSMFWLAGEFLHQNLTKNGRKI